MQHLQHIISVQVWLLAASPSTEWDLLVPKSKFKSFVLVLAIFGSDPVLACWFQGLSDPALHLLNAASLHQKDLLTLTLKKSLPQLLPCSWPSVHYASKLVFPGAHFHRLSSLLDTQVFPFSSAFWLRTTTEPLVSPKDPTRSLATKAQVAASLCHLLDCTDHWQQPHDHSGIYF